jgi:WD40 repeat protein
MSDERGESSNTANVNTAGGAYIEGDITAGGDIVLRDKIVYTEEAAYDVRGLPNPYLGLAAFTYDDRAKYGGRQRDIAAAVAKLTDPAALQALMFVTGASGSGKSSFAQAGLIPALEAHYAGLDVKHGMFRPSRDPIAGLRDALWRQFGLPPLEATNLMPESFAEYLRQHTPPRQVNVIVVDQFEELFTQAEPDKCDALITVLSNLPSFAQARTQVIATLRSDYLPELFKLPALFEFQKRCSIELRAMSEAEMREAIQKPVQATYPDKGKRFDPTLIAQLASDAAEDAAYLPLLQVTLEDTWDKGRLVRGAYTNLGDAIEGRANKVLDYADYPDCCQPRSDAEKQAVLSIFLDLVEVSLDDDPRRDVRLRLTRDDLEGNAPERRRLIDALVSARLLSIARINDDAPVTVDIIHESLLREWDALRSAIADQRRLLQQRARFRHQVNDWVNNNRSSDYLLSGMSLAAARELDKQDDRALQGGDARELLRQSIERAEREQQLKLAQAEALAQAERRRASVARIATVVVSLLLVVALAAFGFGVARQREAEQAAVNAVSAKSTASAEAARAVRGEQQAVAQQKLSRSRELAALVISQLSQSIGSDPERALLLAIESAKTATTVEADNALRKALDAFPLHFRVKAHTDAIHAVQFSPNGQRIATASADKSVGIWDANTGRQIAKISLPDEAGYVFFSSDSKRIVTLSKDMTAQIWDAESGDSLGIIGDKERTIFMAQLPMNKDRVLLTTGDDTVHVWDISTGRQIKTYKAASQSVITAQFSNDESRILTRNNNKTVTLWNSQTQQLVGTYLLKGEFRDVQLAPTGKRVAIVTRGNLPGDMPPVIWEPEIGKVITLTGHTDDVSEARFSPDGEFVVTSSLDNTARAWRASDGKPADSIDPDQVLGPHNNEVFQVLFSQDGKLVATNELEHMARVFGADFGQFVSYNKSKLLMKTPELPDSIYDLAFSPDNARLATGCADGSLWVWFVHSGQLKYAYDKITEDELRAGYADMTASSAPEPASVLASSIDNQLVLSSNYEILNTETNSVVATLHEVDIPINQATFSPDKKLLAARDTHGVPDERKQNADIYIWEVATGAKIAIISGIVNIRVRWEVSKLRFLPDSQRLFTFDGEYVRIWDARTGVKTVEFGGNYSIESARLSSSGELIFARDFDGLVKAYLVNTTDLLKMAQSRTTLQLTCQERVTYLNETLNCINIKQ